MGLGDGGWFLDKQFFVLLFLMGNIRLLGIRPHVCITNLLMRDLIGGLIKN